MDKNIKGTNLLSNLKKLEIPIDWATILVGWKEIGLRQSTVSSNQVIEYATEYLSTHPDDVSEALMSLVILLPTEVEYMEYALRKLVNETHGSLEVAQRKWRLLLLIQIKEEISKMNPLYGLIRLTEFWEKFDYPDDMPHTIQGKGNQISPNSYYNLENFERILEMHEQWVVQETALLRGN